MKNRINMKMLSLILSVILLSSCSVKDRSIDIKDIPPEAINNSEDENTEETIKELDDMIFKNYEPITFGRLNNEPIKWYIIEEKDNYNLLLSESVLDIKQFHNTKDIVSYEKTSLYDYLKNELGNDIFSDEEKKSLIEFEDGLFINLPKEEQLTQYFGKIVDASIGFYGDKEYFAANKEVVANPFYMSNNEVLVNDVFDNRRYAQVNNVDIDMRYNFADGKQSFWIYDIDNDNKKIYKKYITATGYKSITEQDNEYVGIRPVVKISK